MPSNVEAELRTQLTAAMKARDSKTANLIRMINTKVMERRTAKDFTGEVDDALILDVIGAYKKQMEKAKLEFANAGERGKEQIAELEFEIQWAAKWLPQGLGEAELRAAVAKVVAGLPAKDPKMAGKVIGAIKKEFGDRADAQMTKKIAEELLSS
ncbi:MAG: GatB/YqeY domain-containing protein [Deltaproteobacteria bacterium]